MNERIYNIVHGAGCDALVPHCNHAGRIGQVLAGALILALSVIYAPPVRADLTVNVDDRVEVSFTDMVVGQTVKTYSTEATVTNTSDNPILAPMRLVISDIEQKNISLSNADGVTSGGLPFIEIDLAGAALDPNDTSPPATLEFRRRAGDSPAEAPGRGRGEGLGKTKHPNFPTFDFGHSVFVETSVVLSAPSSTPFALAAGVGAVDVAFSVSAVTEGETFGGEVFLQGPELGNGLQMDDGDGDGIFSATVAVSAEGLAGGDCLSYTARTVSAEGIAIESPAYDLCATRFPIAIGESNTAVGNQVTIDEGQAVADELLVVTARGTSESVIDEIEKLAGGEVIGTLLPHGLYQLRLAEPLTANELRNLERRIERIDGVGGAGPNFIGNYTAAPNDPDFPLQHALQLVSSDDPTVVTPRFVWDAGATGSGITVLVLDSGIDESHPDLTLLPENSPGDNTDTLGHGTEMAGIIGALTDNTDGVAAMARDTQLRSIRISADNDVTEAEIMSGFTTALPLAGPNVVVNASFSIYPLLGPTVDMCEAIDDLIEAGSVVVNSAGNNGVSTDNVFPGNCNHPTNVSGLLEIQDNDGDGEPNIIATANKPSFIVVAASSCSSGTCATDGLKSDSNSGIWVDIAAPGVNVRTTTIPGTYTGSDGTSAAAALTSGGAAVLRSCGVATTDVFSELNAGATVAVTPDFNRINLYNSLEGINTSPTAIGLSASTTSIDEFVDTTGGFVIGDLTTADTTVCDAHAYSVTGGADAAAFSISGNQLLLDDGVLDFETQASYTVQVTSTDFYGVATTETFTVTVNDLPEPVITELVSCGTDNTSGDRIFRGFYHPSYPGTSIDQVELFISADDAGDHTVRLDVRAGTYDGTLIASDTQTRTLFADRLANVSYVFDLGNAAVVPGSTVTFTMTLTAGPLSPLEDNIVFFAVDATEHPLGVPDPTPSCDINETIGTTPPLDTFRRDGVWIRIDGEP